VSGGAGLVNKGKGDGGGAGRGEDAAGGGEGEPCDRFGGGVDDYSYCPSLTRAASEENRGI
jgi:hypothetical protein